MSPNESIIFGFYKKGKILCEMREYRGKLQPCILGGSVETKDRESTDYLKSAIVREAAEELGVVVTKINHVGQFVSNRRLFHVAIIYNWQGNIGKYNAENGNRLTWIDEEEMLPSIELEPLKYLLREALK